MQLIAVNCVFIAQNVFRGSQVYVLGWGLPVLPVAAAGGVVRLLLIQGLIAQSLGTLQ